jgi:hypothetical protein
LRKRACISELATEGRATLYDLLAEAAPAGTFAGETSLTATKETLDGDSEEASDGEVIYGRGG